MTISISPRSASVGLAVHEAIDAWERGSIFSARWRDFNLGDDECRKLLEAALGGFRWRLEIPRVAGSRGTLRVARAWVLISAQAEIWQISSRRSLLDWADWHAPVRTSRDALQAVDEVRLERPLSVE